MKESILWGTIKYYSIFYLLTLTVIFILDINDSLDYLFSHIYLYRYIYGFILIIIFTIILFGSIAFFCSRWLKNNALSNNVISKFIAQISLVGIYLLLATFSILISNYFIEMILEFNTFDPNEEFWQTAQRLFVSDSKEIGLTFFVVHFFSFLFTMLIYIVLLKFLEEIFRVRNDNTDINDTKINQIVFKHITFLVAFVAVICLGITFVEENNYIYISDTDTLYKAISTIYYGVDYYEIADDLEVEEFKEEIVKNISDPQRSLFWLSMIVLIPYVNLVYKSK